MSSPQISLAMLARSAYLPASTPAVSRTGHDARAQATPFEAEPARQTVKASPSVRIELSDAARSTLLGLQEIAVAPPPDPGAQETPQQGAPAAADAYALPGSRLNLSI